MDQRQSGGVSTCYAIFEGGGAKGITHLGALKALKDLNIGIVGVAGTSAGAIVAALVATGHEPDELYRLEGDDPRDILTRLGKGPVDLLGRSDWRRLRLLMRSAWLGKLLGLVLCALFAVSLLWRFATLPMGWRDMIDGKIIPGLFIATLVLIGYFGALLWTLPLRRGLMSTRPMAVLLDDILRRKLDKLHGVTTGSAVTPAPRGWRRLLWWRGRSGATPRQWVRFADLDPGGSPPASNRTCPLKIVVTDVTNRRLELFGAHTPEASIAQVVAASAAIPVIFSPPVIDGYRGRVFADGGLVSNLPAWSFRDEKRRFEREVQTPPVPILAFTLTDTGDAPAERLSAFDYVRGVVTTGIFGSQKTIEDFVGDLTVIDLESPLGTLDFDCDREAADAAFRAGRDCAHKVVGRMLGIEMLTRAAARRVWQEVNGAVAARRAATGLPPPRLRLAVIDPVLRRDQVAGRAGFRVVSGWGMQKDGDDVLEIDERNPLAPEAFRTGLPRYGRIGGQSPGALMMTKYEHALLPERLDSAICIPIFDAAPDAAAVGGPDRVLCLDSDDALDAEFADPAFMAMFARAGAQLAPGVIATIVRGVQSEEAR